MEFSERNTSFYAYFILKAIFVKKLNSLYQFLCIFVFTQPNLPNYNCLSVNFLKVLYF